MLAWNGTPSCSSEDISSKAKLPGSLISDSCVSLELVKSAHSGLPAGGIGTFTYTYKLWFNINQSRLLTLCGNQERPDREVQLLACRAESVLSFEDEMPVSLL